MMITLSNQNMQLQSTIATIKLCIGGQYYFIMYLKFIFKILKELHHFLLLKNNGKFLPWNREFRSIHVHFCMSLFSFTRFMYANKNIFSHTLIHFLTQTCCIHSRKENRVIYIYIYIYIYIHIHTHTHTHTHKVGQSRYTVIYILYTVYLLLAHPVYVYIYIYIYIYICLFIQGHQLRWTFTWDVMTFIGREI